MLQLICMPNLDGDAFSEDEHILPETTEEWEAANRPDLSPISTEDADEFWDQPDAMEQVDAVIAETHGGIDFDARGSQRAREHYREERSHSSHRSSVKLQFERLEDRQGGDPWNEGGMVE